MDIPPAAFLPHPAVTSTVLKIRRRKEPAVKVADRKLFFRLVKMGFGQRRKVFTNAMKSGGISTELGKKILERAGIDGGRRGGGGVGGGGRGGFRLLGGAGLLPMHGMNWW